jgi:hypothetical protein
MLKVINEGLKVAKVIINGKVYDAKTGKQLDIDLKKFPPIPKEPMIKNTRRVVKTSNAASRATFVKPVVVAKSKPKSLDGIAPSAATRPNPINSKKGSEKGSSVQKNKIQRKKLLQGITIVVIIIVGFGLLTFFYFPSFSVNFAASQAGISGVSFPSYTVEGYSMDGAVQVENRAITINYRNGEGEIYSISQQSSNWDSEGLLENHIVLERLNYQVLTQRGLTIYRLDDGATWVSGGILYKISNGEQLDNDQILRIIEGI